MRRLAVGLAATLLLGGLQLAGVQGNAQAQETSDSCSSTTIGASSQDVGDKQVVISVHGLGSKPETWGIRGRESYEGSVHQTIDSIESDTYYYAFDYSERNQFWVTDPDIGPKLADTIKCLAQLSRDGGGIGEVVLVTHSMGGLAAKLAASLAPGDVGLVFNIGTPHEGSFYANAGSWGMDRICSGILRAGEYLARRVNDAACDENAAIEGLSIDSDKLGELPSFPDDVSVKAIAGNVTRQLKFGKLVFSAELNSDLVVPTYSAKDVYTNNGDGDGVEEVGCTGFVTTPVIITDASCAHTKMLRDPNVQQEVKDSIEEFIDSNQLYPDCPSERELVAVDFESGRPELSYEERQDLIDEAVDYYEFEIFCYEEWVTAKLIKGGDGVHLYEWDGSDWKILGTGSTWRMDHAEECERVPDPIAERLSC